MDTSNDGDTTYRVIFDVQSPIRLGRDTKVRVTGPGIEMGMVTLYREDPHGTKMPGPIQIEVAIPAPDLRTAVSRAAESAEVLASLVALAGHGPVSSPRLMIVYEVRADERAREFQQYFHDDIGLRPTRHISEADVTNLIRGLDRTPRKTNERLRRALRSYRMAMLESDILERFLLIMTAFESINPPLATLLNVPRRRDDPCPHCGKAIARPWSSGMYTWLTNTCGADVSGKTGRLRNGYVHGFRSLDELSVEVSQIAASVEAALADALKELMGVPPLALPPQPLPARYPFQIAVRGQLTGDVEVGVITTGTHPQLSGGLVVDSSGHIPGTDRITVGLRMNGTAVLPDGVQLNLEAYQLPYSADILSIEPCTEVLAEVHPPKPSDTEG